MIGHDMFTLVVDIKPRLHGTATAMAWLPVRYLWGRWQVWWHGWVVTTACTSLAFDSSVGPGRRRCQCPCGYGYVIIYAYIYTGSCWNKVLHIA